MADVAKDDVEFTQKDGAGDQPEKPGRVKRLWKNMVKALRDDDDTAREEATEDMGESLPDSVTALKARKSRNAKLERAYSDIDK